MKKYLTTMILLLAAISGLLFGNKQASQASDITRRDRESSSGSMKSDSQSEASSESNYSSSHLAEASNDESSQEDQTGLTFDSIEELVGYTIDQYQLDPNALSIAWTDLRTGEEFHHNSQVAQHAASTNKVGTAALYANLINQGILSWESEIAYDPSYWEDGGGEITAGPPEASYSIYELVYQSLYYSDNTAWNMLINNYYQQFGDFQSDLIALSGIEVTDPELYNINYANADMLNQILIYLASDSGFEPITDIMRQAQEGIFLKMYVDNMAAKYGQYEDSYHDTGIYYQGDQPIYTIAVMSHDQGSIDYFLGDLNLYLSQWVQK
ncbi:serine hydrolase [Hutsoniella sourekii]|uniref:serine hydrolase n=1 Tax=Hutsoniella sourekii TaxID=87650 RepID=UPI0004BBA77D|nr:serine hydrolase [Hutsoniella sourekii]